MRALIITCLICLSANFIFGQMVGPSTAYVDETKTYTFSNGTIYPYKFWECTNCTVMSTWISGITYFASVKFTTAGSATVRFLDQDRILRGNLNVTVNLGPPNTTFTYTNNCGFTVITRNTNPPTGVNWYWQTSSTGTSTSNMTSSNTVTTAGTYYLRARWGSTGPWSSSSQATAPVTISSGPAPPATGTNGAVIGSGQASVPLPLGSVAGATAYRWYTTPTGGTPVATTPTPSFSATVPSGTTQNYYVESFNGSCPSSSRFNVTATVYAAPTVVTNNNATLIFNGSVTLSVSNPNFDSYTWLDTNNNPIAGATSSSYITYQPGTYKLRVTKGSAPAFVTPGVVVITENYITTSEVFVPTVNESTVSTLPIGSRSQVTQFFDGLGRSEQVVNRQGSPLSKDVVQPVAYDQFGRETVKYLPYVSTGTDGWLKSGFVKKEESGYSTSPQAQFYQTSVNVAIDSKPYSESIPEASPLDRVLKDYGAGHSWSTAGSNKYIEHQYQVNVHNTGVSATQEKVIAWALNGAGMPVRSSTVTNYILTNGYYANGQLSIKVTWDEQRNAVREYVNKKGQVILKKVQAAAGSNNLNGVNDWALTYYVYDDLGNLRFVFPPELSKRTHSTDTYVPSAAELGNWAFQYRYDSRRRMTEKKVPGADAMYMVYDKRDRLVLTQDGNQRSGATKYWTFTKYDELNRPVLTGIKDTTAALTQAQMQTAVNAFYNKTWARQYETYVGNATGNVHGYTNKSYPVVNKAATTDKDQYLTVTYYDKYDFRSLWVGTYTYVSDALSQTINSVTYTQPATGNENQRVTGQVTGNKTKVLDGGVAGGFTWLKSVNYYDDKYRIIQSQVDNYKGGIDRSSNLYDFAGKVLMTKTTHIERDVTWKDFVGARQDGNKLIRTATGSAWGTSGAASVQQLAASTNGWIEVDASEKTLARMIGLSDANTDANYTSLDYAWYQYLDGTLHIYESGTSRGTFGAYAPGDVLKIERTGTSVKYYQNNVLKYTSTVASSSVLMADASIHGANGTLVNVRSSFSQNTRTITRRFIYDHAGRMIETWHRVDTQPEVRIAYNQYNELGQLIDKKLHSTTALAANAKQSVDYLYNIRGWLTKINNSDVSTVAAGDAVRDYFGMELGYNGTIGTGNTGLFNGNISGIKWSVNQGYSTMKQMAYNYTYDPMNRLLTAVNYQNSGSWVAGQYDESGFTYDLNGNIKALQRKGVGGVQIDNLVYNYGSGATASNKLLYVQDNTVNVTDKAKGFVDGNIGTTTDYTYDVNGNMTRDLNKGIGVNLTDATNLITYNFLNLPETVTKGGNNVRYIYDASGRKLSQVVTTGTIQKQTDYAGEFVYENDALQFINHEEGRITTASTKLIVTDAGESTTTMTAVNSTLATFTNNGEKYIRVTSSGTTARTGVFPIGGAITVQAGERYRIRAKGYIGTGTNAVYLAIKANSTDLNWPGATLPPSAATESWIEQTVTIPAGATTLQAGVTWNTVTSGAIFYLNEFEITQLTTVTPEYQYHLKDHLGNVRVTFTSKDETESATATLETANMNAEQAKFLRYQNARRIQSSLFDRTNGASTGYAQRLNGSANEKYGLARSLSVMPGDRINMEVYAKYVDTNSANWNAALTTLMTQIAAGTAPAGTVVDGSGYTTSTSSFPFGGLVNTTGSTGGPKAYLNYILFDRNFAFKTGGYKRLSATPRETGNDVAHERLFFDNLTITEPGYIYIFLSNEETSPVEVFFDDFKVEHIKSPILESQDYYPFGLTYNQFARENAVPNRWKFQGQEHVDDLGLNWDSFKWRNHQPDIGRFFNVDPLADKYVYNSPYAFSENKVTAHVELEGLESYPINPNSNPLYYTAEGFRQYFQAIGTQVDKAYVSVSLTLSRVVKEVKANLGVGEADIKSTVNVTNTTTVKPNLGEFFTNNNNNKPGGPVVKVENETTVTKETSVEVTTKVNTVDVTGTSTTSVDLSNGDVSQTSEANVGKNGSGAFVSMERSSKESKTDAGVQANYTKDFNNFSFTINVKAGFTIQQSGSK